MAHPGGGEESAESRLQLLRQTGQASPPHLQAPGDKDTPCTPRSPGPKTSLQHAIHGQFNITPSTRLTVSLTHRGREEHGPRHMTEGVSRERQGTEGLGPDRGLPLNGKELRSEAKTEKQAGRSISGYTVFLICCVLSEILSPFLIKKNLMTRRKLKCILLSL